jgi:hypothetical protein
VLTCRWNLPKSTILPDHDRGNLYSTLPPNFVIFSLISPHLAMPASEKYDVVVIGAGMDSHIPSYLLHKVLMM